jgi:hypothetical protein
MCVGFLVSLSYKTISIQIPLHWCCLTSKWVFASPMGLIVSFGIFANLTDEKWHFMPL